MFGRLDLTQILYSLPAVFLAFSFHEFAHALAAYRLGDSTPKMQGRLTLDPLAHVDWIGLIMFTIFGFGWARPVQVNPSNFKNRKWGDILVSLAGPIANFILGFIAIIILNLLGHAYSHLLINGFSRIIGVFFSIIYQVATLNIVFGFLNLIPIPPFDGYKVIKNLFFRKNIKFFWVIEKYSIILFLVMIIFNIYSFLINTPSRYVYGLFDNFADKLFGFFF